MRKNNYSWLTEAGATKDMFKGLKSVSDPENPKYFSYLRDPKDELTGSGTKSLDKWYETIWGWIAGGFEKLWNGIQSALKWVFGQGKEGEGSSSLLQGIKWILGKIKEFIMYIWNGGEKRKGYEKGLVGAGNWAKDKLDSVKNWKVWGTINDKMSADLVGGVSGWGILAGAAVIGIVVYGIYRLYKWFKNRKSVKKSLSETASPQSWVDKGLSVTSTLTPNMVGSVFGPAAGNFFGGCAMVLQKAGASARVAEGTYRVLRNAGLKKKAAGRIARHTFSECIAQ